MKAGSNEKESASWSSTVMTAIGANHPDHNSYSNPGRYNRNRDAGHSDCQLKQVIGHIWTGPTSRRQYDAFLKLTALQYFSLLQI